MQPKGAIVRGARREVFITEERSVLMTGLFRAIVNTKAARSARYRKAWERLVHALGLNIIDLGDGWYDVATDDQEDFVRLEDHSCVLSLQYAVNVRVPWAGSGGADADAAKTAQRKAIAEYELSAVPKKVFPPAPRRVR